MLISRQLYIRIHQGTHYNRSSLFQQLIFRHSQHSQSFVQVAFMRTTSRFWYKLAHIINSTEQPLREPFEKCKGNHVLLVQSDEKKRKHSRIDPNNKILQHNSRFSRHLQHIDLTSLLRNEFLSWTIAPKGHHSDVPDKRHQLPRNIRTDAE